jgi:hypothetical protein
MYRFNVAAVVFLTIILTACSVTPRTSNWDSPQRFTKHQVYNAALQAGGMQGMQTTASDRQSGTMSFTRLAGKKTVVLSANITDNSGIIHVSTVVSVGGGLAIRGLHEEYIKNFHVFLFRNLNITDVAERNLVLEQLK